MAPADPESPPSLLQLLAALDQQPGQSQALTSLRHDVVTGLVRAAQEVHALRADHKPVPERLRIALQGCDLEPPGPWQGRAAALRELKPFLRLMRDHNYLAQQASELVGTA